jgi:2-methylcitrate dehydratase
MLGATAEQIESAIGMVVAHYIPFRAIRAGKQLSDSKGASAAISTEAAIRRMQRSMRASSARATSSATPRRSSAVRADRQHRRRQSPFDLVLSHSGDDFAVMGMHFKLGLYEHQSAGAIQALIDLLAPAGAARWSARAEDQVDHDHAYEPAFGIIGDPAKRIPRTRQSADHSMVYIIATLLRKAV